MESHGHGPWAMAMAVAMAMAMGHGHGHGIKQDASPKSASGPSSGKIKLWQDKASRALYAYRLLQAIDSATLHGPLILDS